MSSNSHINNFIQWGLKYEGSSRTSALIRIGLALLIWSRWAYSFTYFYQEQGFGHLFATLFFIFTTMMLLGFYSRISTLITSVLTFAIYYYFGFKLGYSSWTHHHTYLLCIATFLCSLTPCGKSYSLDRYLSIKKSIRANIHFPPESGNLWGLRLISIQLSLIYFWTAFNKTNFVWLSGERMQHHYMYYLTGSSHPEWIGFSTIMAITAWSVVLLEYLLCVGLLFKKTRKWLLIPGILLHCMMYIFLPVRTFSLTMILLYLSYVDANHVHRIINMISGVMDYDSKVKVT